MEHTTRLSKLMRLSWQVQRRRKLNRSKALTTAWAIVLNEDIMVYHLVNRYGVSKHERADANSLSLFQTK